MELRMTCNSRLPTAHCLLPTAYCLPPTAYCPLPTAHCLLPTAYCPLPTANAFAIIGGLELRPRERTHHASLGLTSQATIHCGGRRLAQGRLDWPRDSAPTD